MCCDENVFNILIGFEVGIEGLSLLNRFLSTDRRQLAKLCCLYKVQNFWLHYKNVAWGS